MAKAIEELLGEVVSGLGLSLTPRQLEQLATHFALLLRWNQKINLTSLRRPEEIATRHFEESLFLLKIAPCAPGLPSDALARRPKALGHRVAQEGLLVDVGSGAGFPGLPIKVACPSLSAVLLEPNKKKAAFLKEVVRTCDLKGVEVRAERLEEVLSEPPSHPSRDREGAVIPSEPREPAPSRVEGLRSGFAPSEQGLPGSLAGRASLVTLRAVKPSRELLDDLAKLLAPGGRLALFLGTSAATTLAATPGFQWSTPVAIPHSQRRVILLGRRAT